MSKKENHKNDLAKFFDEFLKTRDEEKIIEYIISNSNLPGPRGNLELAQAFAEIVEEYFTKDSEKLWSLSLKLVEISIDEAPVDDPKEMLPFCGARSLGAIGSTFPAYFPKTFSLLKELANDPRWRTREGVAMAIQEFLKKRGPKTLKDLESWIQKDNWLVMRAVAAGVAEPALFKK
ncbi:MAG: HEAT repeat domain-containing protein [Candidatus Jordarchaeum sp.]|uniref:HEAT repeat domain-containing protein n=1 Tax=Candidatus Jordarchaeum sp. TaxID=2823881 RepID=UPI004048EFEA